MTALAPLREVEAVTDGARATALVQHPVRRRILALARTPMSATEMAAKLGLPRQRVNDHVRQLERARSLSRAERCLRRNMVEQRYVVTARSYVIAPELLGARARGVQQGPTRVVAVRATGWAVREDRMAELEPELNEPLATLARDLEATSAER